MNRESFAPDEWYHCYTRGVDKRQTFFDIADYQRFHELLYLCNTKESVHRSNLSKKVNIFEKELSSPLVEVGAYCLMPNHFHLLLKEIDGTGISTFMRKLGTGYAMYFNKRYERVGNLFVKPFRSKHVIDDDYAKQVSAYIHLNPLDLYEPKWRDATTHLDKAAAENFLENYYYSSYIEYATQKRRSEKSIIAEAAVQLLSTYDANRSFEALLDNGRDFIKVTP